MVMVDFFKNEKIQYFFIFFLGVFIRGLPELLVSEYPIGFETITYYAPPMFSFNQYTFSEVFFQFLPPESP